MRASATITVDAGRTELRSEPPLTLRTTPRAVYLVGSAAGPVGGDELTLSTTVGAGSRLEVRSAAAAMHHPSPRPAASSLDTDIRLGSGAHLHWSPEPGILIEGCDHHAATRVDLAPGSTLVWREEWALGRLGEPGGSVLTRLRIERAGRPLVRSDQALGPRWPGADGPAGVGHARAVGSLVVVAPDLPAWADQPTVGQDPALAPSARAESQPRWAPLRIAPDVVVVSAVADRSSHLAALLDRLVADLAPFAPPPPVGGLAFPSARSLRGTP